MPLVRVSVYNSTPPATRKAIASAIYEAMRGTIGIPEGDRFIVLTAHDPAELFIDPNYMDANRTEQYVLVQIFLSRGRTVEKKQALYARVAQRLHEEAGIPIDDVMIVLNENSFEDWSFCKGEAQYVLNPPAWAQKTPQGN
jgi:phenylpyruvate tautomerase PptA (4-oxalocrotonate tautomerase family)